MYILLFHRPSAKSFDISRRFRNACLCLECRNDLHEISAGFHQSPYSPDPDTAFLDSSNYIKQGTCSDFRARRSNPPLSLGNHASGTDFFTVTLKGRSFGASTCFYALPRNQARLPSPHAEVNSAPSANRLGRNGSRSIWGGWPEMISAKDSPMGGPNLKP